MKNDVHGVRSMLRQLLQYRVPWLFRRHRTIFRTGKKFERTTTSQTCADSSSETQGQIVGTRESLNGRENMARRKVKNGENEPRSTNAKYHYSYLFFYKMNKGDLPFMYSCVLWCEFILALVKKLIYITHS